MFPVNELLGDKLYPNHCRTLLEFLLGAPTPLTALIPHHAPALVTYKVSNASKGYQGTSPQPVLQSETENKTRASAYLIKTQ